MKCSDCDVALVGIGRKYCPKCFHIYKRADSTWEKTSEKFYPVETFVLQEGLELNPCFTTQVKDFQRVAKREPTATSDPSDELDGFRVRPPLLHFIWFGTPDSFEKFVPVFQWAALLPSTWKGVCLWLEDTCFAKLVAAGRWRIERKKGSVATLTDEEITTLGSCAVEDGATVHFASIDAHLKSLARTYDTPSKKNVATLAEAIDFERKHDPPLRLVQVASDIMRVIVLKFFGGAYFDFDVAPSAYTKTSKFTAPMLLPLGAQGFLCHRKGMINENDIVFADPRRGEAVLNGLVGEMLKFYRRPSFRQELLVHNLAKAFGEGEYEKVIATYKAGLKPSPALLLKLAEVVEQDLHRGVKTEYRKVLAPEVVQLVSLVNDTVEEATFSGYQGFVGSENGDAWDKMKRFFSEATLTKPFYSWKDPGASQALELIEAVITLQAAIRSFLAGQKDK